MHMTISALLEVLTEMGVSVRSDDGNLFVSPRDALSPALEETIRRHKEDLLNAFASKAVHFDKISPKEVRPTSELVSKLGSLVSTPVGEGRLLYLTIHGAVVQVGNGLMYTIDPRKVKP